MRVSAQPLCGFECPAHVGGLNAQPTLGTPLRPYRQAAAIDLDNYQPSLPARQDEAIDLDNSPSPKRRRLDDSQASPDEPDSDAA